jgi:NAD(P)-dependent dehydrogenase (short-subunit alcohol dehydrogenase family)
VSALKAAPLAGKTVLVTGATDDIGSAIVRQLAQGGARRHAIFQQHLLREEAVAVDRRQGLDWVKPSMARDFVKNFGKFAAVKEIPIREMAQIREVAVAEKCADALQRSDGSQEKHGDADLSCGQGGGGQLQRADALARIH